MIVAGTVKGHKLLLLLLYPKKHTALSSKVQGVAHLNTVLVRSPVHTCSFPSLCLFIPSLPQAFLPPFNSRLCFETHYLSTENVPGKHTDTHTESKLNSSLHVCKHLSPQWETPVQVPVSPTRHQSPEAGLCSWL